ncbi:hypothetical protein B0H12DRAFT_1126065 [Mycena haematopus]|nr:hypothetical protein B0H12DRAFT_1126065 [Mycena haematopus]
MREPPNQLAAGINLFRARVCVRTAWRGCTGPFPVAGALHRGARVVRERPHRRHGGEGEIAGGIRIVPGIAQRLRAGGCIARGRAMSYLHRSAAYTSAAWGRARK